MADRDKQENQGKENSLPGTVTLDTSPIDGPGKLDSIDDPNAAQNRSTPIKANQFRPQQVDGDKAVQGEHSQVDHGDGRTTSDWKREADDAFKTAPGVSQESLSLNNPPSSQSVARGTSTPENTQTYYDQEHDTQANMAARGDGSTAVHGEHSQVDRWSNGGTTSDWKNMPASSYQGVAGITDADRNRGSMSTDWSGTAASEHPTSEDSGSDIRNQSSGGTTSQQSSLGQ